MDPRSAIWGNVPADGDVVPFSHLNSKRGAKGRNNKRHHFVSVTYMNGFVDNDGKVWAYRSEAPETPTHVRPSGTGYEKYYYSKKLPDGEQENHELEDFWGTIEEAWPATIRAVRDHRLSHAISFNVLGMLAIMKTRVPAARDRNALLMAAKLRASVQALETLGKLPADIQIYAGKLDRVPVGVNPHRTLATIFDELKDFGDLCFRMGFEVLHNQTATAFVTSDNPVCYYDPSEVAHLRSPYDVGKNIELVFPLDARTLLRGSTRLKPANQVVRHKSLSDASSVRRFNRTIAQFGYRLLIAGDRSSDDLARLYSDRSPTVEVDVRFEGAGGRNVNIYWRHVFGARPQIDLFVDSPAKAAKVQADLEERGIM